MIEFRWLAALDSLGYDGVRMLLSVLWQSAIVFFVFGGLGFLLRKRSASTRHALWTAALLSVPVLMIVSIFLRTSSLPVSPIPIFPKYIEVAPVVSSGLPLHSDASAPDPRIGDSAGGQWNIPLRYPWACACLLYLAGVIILLAPVFMGRLRVRRWIDEGAPILDERVIDICEELSGRFGLRRAVMAVESEHVSVPFTIRFFHPVIVIPKGFPESLSDSELRAVLAHETAHIRRGDSLIGTVTVIIRALFFFHPGVWLAGREIAALAEHSCDDLALDVAETPVSYARLVARIAEHATTRSTTMEYASGIIFSRKSFLRRVEIILSHRKGTIRKLSRPALIGVVFAGGLSLAAAFALPLGDAGKQPEAVKASGKSDTNGRAVQLAKAAKPEVSGIATAIPWIIAGTVTDEAGKPLEGVIVEMHGHGLPDTLPAPTVKAISGLKDSPPKSTPKSNSVKMDILPGLFWNRKSGSPTCPFASGSELISKAGRSLPRESRLPEP